MKLSLRSKLSLSYILIIVLTIGLISLLANIFLDNQFQKYVISKQEQKTNEILNLISQQYTVNNTWEIEYLERIGMNALENGFIVKILDTNDRTIWDATLHNNGLCQQMIYNMSENMSSYNVNWKGEYVEEEFPIYYENEIIGTLKTGFLGPYFFSDEDLNFINTLNKLLLFIGLISLVFAFILGTIISKTISHPISRVISKAHLLSKGQYGDKIKDNSKTKEIMMLVETINNLSDDLKKQEGLRKRLTQDVAHELRTPLTTVQGHLEAMIDGIWDADQKRLKSCYDEILRIKRLIRSIDSLARVESENLKLRKEQFDISKLIKQILNNFENDFIKRKIKVHFEYSSKLVFADKDKISQMLINIIENAIKYTNGGDIYVSVQSNDVLTEIVIEDNGIGIYEQDLPYIFERFYRTDKSRNKETGGIGIGLAIVKAIIDAHKGKIIVDSKKDEGTKFTIYLYK